MAEPEKVTGDVTEYLGQEYYKKEDVEDGPIDLTIKSVGRRTFPLKDKTPEVKLELTFSEEGSKRLSLNKTNLKILIKHCGKDASTWIGRRIQLYLDENVTFQGNLVGGLRIRVFKPRVRPVVVEPPADEVEVEGERVPF